MNKKLKMSLKVTGIALAVGQAFAPNAMAQAAADDTAVVVVQGIRASARSSVAIKREAMEVVDSITADDIGKLPDPNVAETMTRIPGVQGYRYGGEGASPVGEGSGLTIRGLSGLTASQVNGRAYFTAGGREFNIESAIPGMIAGIDVYKNPSAEHIEGGIGGLVNVRTRNPSDFKEFTATLGGTVRYNDLAKKYDPEVFGLVANRFNLGGGSRIGVMAAVSYQKSAARSDSTPANRLDYRRVVGANTAEYASGAAANTGNNPTLPMSAYVGRSDISYLAPVPTFAKTTTVGANMPNTAGLSAEQIGNIVTMPGLNSHVFQETIMRERKGLNLAADYRVSNTLRFYTELNYTHYLYHQNYRFIFTDNAGNGNAGGNVQNLQTTPFAMTESLANRNWNGGSDDLLSSKRVLGATFLNSQVRPWGGDEHSPYTTGVVAAGAEWSPTSALSLKADFSYIDSERKRDNRRVEMAGAAGKTWDISRLAAGEPVQIGFNGPSLSDPSNFVFNGYPQTYISWDDKGHATALNGSYSFDEGLFSKLKFGVRYAHQESLFRDRGFWRPMTTNGKDLDRANFSNAISVSSVPGVLEMAPNNYLDGKGGYTGGYLVYSPDALLGNQVGTLFPSANIPLEPFPENTQWRRLLNENTLAGYLVGEFSALGERIKGSAGVRVVRTDSTATAQVFDQTKTPAAWVDNVQSRSYTNVLPTFNATYDIAENFLARFGYGRGMTRPDLGSLNPSISPNTGNGTGGMGNPDLKPQVADSFDLSFERYFGGANYTSVALFRKNIKGFFNTVARCTKIDFVPAFMGGGNGCNPGEYFIEQKVNAEKGFAQGVEVAGQWFFDAKQGWLRNFGVAGSYTYVDTGNPVNIGTAKDVRIITTQQPFVSKNSVSLSGLYEDSKLSGRLVYTWRSSWLQGGVNANPIQSVYVKPYGLLDASINYAIDDRLTLSFNASNITNEAPSRFIGEAGTYETGRELQHFVNGRMFSIGARYKF
jgi:TonB-dependent receptor